MATEEVQSRPTVPRDGAEIHHRVVFQHPAFDRRGEIGGHLIHLIAQTMKLAMCSAWMPQSANCPDTPAIAGS
jgi:hypothetical protein